MRASETARRLVRRAQRAHVDLSASAVDSLVAYFELLQVWNRKINLTSLTDPDEAVDRLLLEPVVASRYVDASAGHLLDVGSGGGSPAIPLKVMLPASRLWMVESKIRKSAFLREVVRHLGLEDAQVETARFEELLSRPEMNESMDLVTVRAVRMDRRALLALQAFLRPGGEVFFFTGPGGGVESILPPQLALVGSVPLVSSLSSRLVRLRKV